MRSGEPLAGRTPLSAPIFFSKSRGDIDGLRAIAVLSVIQFHTFPELVRGGFVGVDVFFVISGYLITKIILENLQNNQFSFVDFYIRRVRRIFPALAFVLTACFAFGWFSLLASEFQQLGKHIAGGTGFISNIILWGESGYFDNVAETKPLLHLWSLSIEEQYYIVWPLLLWLAWRAKLPIFSLVSVLAIISFGINIYRIDHHAVATFYSAVTRSWELLAGSLLASLHLYTNRPALSEPLTNTLSLLGLTLIGAAILFIPKTGHFPGWLALLPVAGSALVLLAGPKAVLNKYALCSAPMNFIGIISYPLYLWHWPLLSFSRVLSGETPSYTIRITALLFSFILAWVTFRFVEKPLRFGPFKYRKALGLILTMLLIGAVGFVGLIHGGYPSRVYAQPITLLAGDIGPPSYYEYLKKRYYPCPQNIQDSSPKYKDIPRCFQSKPGTQADFALIGDSHAEQLFLGLAESLPNRNIIFLVRDGVPLLVNKKFSDIFCYVMKTQSFKSVLITSFWSKRMRILRSENFTEELAATIEEIKKSGKQVYLTDDIPHYDFDPTRCKFSRKMSLTEQRCSIPKEESDLERSEFISQITEATRKEQIPVLKTWSHFCDASSCSMAKGNALLYRDQNHLNIEGSKYLANSMVKDYPEMMSVAVSRSQEPDSRSACSNLLPLKD